MTTINATPLLELLNLESGSDIDFGAIQTHVTAEPRVLGPLTAALAEKVGSELGIETTSVY